MNIDFLPEPELQFGTARHIDIRFGLMNYGPLDYDSPLAPKQIKVGIAGTPQTVEGLVRWFEKCRGEIPAKQSNQPHLFPRFPGFRPDNNWQSTLVLDSKLQSTIPSRDFEKISATGTRGDVVRKAVEWFLSSFEYLAENSDVFVCAPPMQLVNCMEPDYSPHDGTEDKAPQADTSRPDFHHLLKAKAMAHKKPVQIVLPMTYDETKRRPRRRWGLPRQLQDEATRAWNIHAALYYKARGVPWRLVRDPQEFASCFVGISFYQSLDKSRLLTSVAEVFNERGEGVIVRGGAATLSKDDRQPHLDETGANSLLKKALGEYNREHHTLPARVVLHKTSSFSRQELDGFRSAANETQIHSLELISFHESGTRLFRLGAYPPLRGTLLKIDEKKAVLYTRGAVGFFATYPGMYVPVAVGFHLDDAEQTTRFHAEELLALSKMNWNNTQFDGHEPITIRAAREVGKILKYTGEAEEIQGRYSFYM